mmetsp:Transcript_125337/g.220752  ORF Transcript_125337/g.220752 Transcript_125337/m.220752 type:complete len:694 (-) Transcript_125337:53-2134(-)
MKSSIAAVFLLFLAAPLSAEASDPLGTTIALLKDLSAKISSEAAVAEKTAAEYAKWCKEKITDIGFDIETGESSKEDLEATIGKMTANIAVESSKIDDLAASISEDDAELTSAQGARASEESTFKASEAELVDSIDVLSRAIGILGREMSKNPAALLQMDTSNVQAMIKSITAVVDAAAFSSSDQKKLVALVQAQSGSDADDEELAAPAAAVYKTHSTSILDVIEDLKEKAEAELGDLRKAEMTATHNFEMLKQSLTDSIEADEKRLAESKASKASFAEMKATAEGDLAVTEKTLAEDKATKVSTEEKCAEVAADHEASMKGRSEELAAIAEAKKVLSETSAGAVGQSYSFIQVATDTKANSHALLANVEIVNLVKKLAKEHHSAALAQLASRVATVFRYGVQAGANPFAKVKDLISDLIAKLEKEASEEASEKAFCEEEMSKTDAKKSDLESELSSLTSKIDTATAKSTKLKGQVKQLQADLAELAKVQAEATTLRQETHAEYLESKADFEAGLSGVRKAITVLKDYYGSAAFIQQPAAPESYSKSTGKGNSIIDILEVAESDFAENLAKGETEESDAAAAYEKGTQEYELTKSTKEQDVKYMEKEYKALDKSVVQISSDKESTSTELAAVLEYDAKLKERCVAKPESYESRKAAREAEIAGLKEALKILETETAFMQRRKRMHKHGFLTAL